MGPVQQSKFCIQSTYEMNLAYYNLQAVVIQLPLFVADTYQYGLLVQYNWSIKSLPVATRFHVNCNRLLLCTHMAFTMLQRPCLTQKGLKSNYVRSVILHQCYINLLIHFNLQHCVLYVKGFPFFLLKAASFAILSYTAANATPILFEILS